MSPKVYLFRWISDDESRLLLCLCFWPIQKIILSFKAREPGPYHSEDRFLIPPCFCIQAVVPYQRKTESCIRGPGVFNKALLFALANIFLSPLVFPGTLQHLILGFGPTFTWFHLGGFYGTPLHNRSTPSED